MDKVFGFEPKSGKTLLDIYKIYFGKEKHEAFIQELKLKKIYQDSETNVLDDASGEEESKQTDLNLKVKGHQMDPVKLLQNK